MKLPAIVRLLSMLGVRDIKNEDTDINEELDILLLSLAAMAVFKTNRQFYSQNKLKNHNTGNPYFA